MKKSLYSLSIIVVFSFLSNASFAIGGNNNSQVLNGLNRSHSKLKQNNVSNITTITMCGGISQTTDSTGTLYDSGGFGNYLNNENCSLLIHPSCASTITLNFISFNTEGCCDHLYIYDGPNASSPLIGNYSGSIIPPTIIAGSSVYLTWFTDGSVPSSGFQIDWTSSVSGSLQTSAAFTVSNSNPALNSRINFTDHSTNSPLNWSWNFGDGTNSTDQNPTHVFTSPGIYSIKMRAANCSTVDSVVHTVNVQNAPVYSVIPDSISLTIACGDSASTSLAISNSGTGQLIYQISGSGGGILSGDTVRILSVMEGVDITGEYPNTLLAIASHFQKYSITQFLGIDSTSLRNALANIDVLLFPEQESGIANYHSAIRNVVLDFLALGKTVVLCGSSGNGSFTRPFDLGLFNGAYQSNVTGGTLNNVNPTDPINDSVSTFFSSPNLAEYYDFTDANLVRLFEYPPYDVVCYRTVNGGKAVFVGFDYFSSNPDADRLLSNTIKNVNPGLTLGTGISATPVRDTVAVGATSIVDIEVRSTGLNAGVYDSYIYVNTNDPLTPVDSIPLHLVITGSPAITLSDTCFSYGAIVQFTTKSDTLRIGNLGCATLVIDSIVSGNSVFTTSFSNANVLPSQFNNLLVNFHPLSVGSFTSNLTIYTNQGIRTICLSGSAGSAPQIVVSPTSLSTSFTTCLDSITFPIYVHNVGGVNLNVTVGSNSASSPHVLINTYGADSAGELIGTHNGINHYFTNWTFSDNPNTDAASLSAGLPTADILLFPEQESLTGYYSGISTVVQNYVTNGGIVILCGASGTLIDSRPMDLGLFSGTFIGASSSISVDVVDTADGLMDNVNPTFLAPSATFYYQFTNADLHRLVTYTGLYDIVSYRDIGAGRAIYCGFDYFQNTDDIDRIISNAVSHPRGYSLPNWLTTDTTAFSVAPADSQLVNVTFHNNTLAGGTYTTYILFSSNDPLHPVDSLPVTMNISNHPCINFNHTNASNCSGTINFNDQTTNSPTSWNWDFGDGSTSTQQNPSHTYAANGIYFVQLRSCNVTGCDSLTQQVVMSSAGGPVGVNCTPATTGYCCGVGILDVEFNGISQSSPDASEGYRDFTCVASTSCIQGQSYPVTITTGSSYDENLNIWIDYNNNGQFDLPGELAFQSIAGFVTHSGTITISPSAVINTSLRMRISSEYSGNPAPGPCTDLQYGQVEDYSVYITSNALPPVAHFNSTVVNSCSGIVQFTDISSYSPSSWSWNFGDGQTSVVQNPLHTYSASGTYTVVLNVINPYGGSSYSSTVTVTVPPASFSVTGILAPMNILQFTSTSAGATSFTWDFGDGYSANLQSPIHIYTANGRYPVTLVIINGACTITLHDTLNIGNINVEEDRLNNSLQVFPNPTSEDLNLKYNLTKNSEVSLEIRDITGRVVERIISNQSQLPGEYKYIFHPKSAGIYMLHLIVNDKVFIRKMVRL